MIQTKTIAMTEVGWRLRTSRGGGRMRRLFSFISKISDFINKLSDISWIIIIYHFVFYYFHINSYRNYEMLRDRAIQDHIVEIFKLR